MSVKTPLYLVDASVYIFRAYFSLPETLVDQEGNPVNAIYGYAGFLHKLIKQSDGEHFAVAFDESLNTSFRNELYPEYKANRELPPEELAKQLKTCQELTAATGLATFVHQRFEADDIIGTIAKKMRPAGFKMVYVSSDKDLSQLIQRGDVLWDFARDQKLTPAKAAERFGVKPQQMVDFLALAGDRVDNIPGVPGIGPKTAASLLHQFKTLDGIYQRLEKIAHLDMRGAARVHKRLREHQEHAYLSQRLARIADNAPIRCTARQLKRKRTNRKELERLCDQLNFGTGIRDRLVNC